VSEREKLIENIVTMLGSSKFFICISADGANISKYIGTNQPTYAHEIIGAIEMVKSDIYRKAIKTIEDKCKEEEGDG